MLQVGCDVGTVVQLGDANAHCHLCLRPYRAAVKHDAHKMSHACRNTGAAREGPYKIGNATGTGWLQIINSRN